MDTTFETLDEQLQALSRKVDAAGEAYRDRRRVLEQLALKQVEAETVGQEYRKLQAEYNQLRTVWQKARDEKSVQDGLTNLMYPEGTVLVEWRSDWPRTPATWRRTAVKGILQVVRPEDRFSSNLRYSVPAVGTRIVRLLKSDNTPGCKFERFDPRVWLPEGKEHPEAKQ